MTKDYYKILGVDWDSSQETIKKAFRTLSKEHHPDHGGDEDKFKEINEAHSVLSDPEKRKDYDNPMRQMGSGFPFDDIFGMRRSRPNPNAHRRGKHIQMQHDAPLHLFIFGGDLKVSFSFNDVCKECEGKGAVEFDKCPNCDGSGTATTVRKGPGVRIQSSGPCPACRGRGGIPKENCAGCGGSGNVKVDREVVLPIPSGFSDGQPVGAAGRGGGGLNGGPPGDLIVKLNMVLPNPDNLTDEQRKVLEEL